MLEVGLSDVKGKPAYRYHVLVRTADGDEGGKHHLINAVGECFLSVERTEAVDLHRCIPLYMPHMDTWASMPEAIWRPRMTASCLRPGGSHGLHSVNG